MPLVDQFERACSSKDTLYAVLLLGTDSLFSVSSGEKTNLRYTFCTFPSYPARKEIKDINPCLYAPEKLPSMNPPDWSPFEWQFF